MMKRRKICVITGSRAEYGLLFWLIKEIKQDEDLELQLIVTGMHLSYEFGLTFKQIEKDGLSIDKKIEILLSSDTPVSISKSMGLAMISFSEAYEELRPDLIVVLGDRFEILSAVSSAAVFRIPVAHLHGGELTEGAFDEGFRHAVSKMSHLHFTATESYRERVIQLGEEPDRVFNTGAPGIDNIYKLPLYTKKSLEEELGFVFGSKNLLVTFHSVTLEESSSKEHFSNLLTVLDSLVDTKIIFTKANADTDGRIINQMIDQFVSNNTDKSIAFTSMGQLRYLSTLQYVDGVVGNSSSGIIEVPSFKIGTVNIGLRQQGRERAASIIDCGSSTSAIQKAIERLYSTEFQEGLMRVKNPHGSGKVAEKIVDVLKSTQLKDIVLKRFRDQVIHNRVEA